MLADYTAYTGNFSVVAIQVNSLYLTRNAESYSPAAFPFDFLTTPLLCCQFAINFHPSMRFPVTGLHIFPYSTNLFVVLFFAGS